MAGMNHSDFKIAWICALPLEMAAAEAMFDQVYPELPRPMRDNNTYKYGRIGVHNVVIACQPAGSIGLVSAAAVATEVRRTFTNLWIGLMVGIGGGVPDVDGADVRLGDVVVSRPTATFGGVVQYDMGKAVNDGPLQRTGAHNRPPDALLTTVAVLEAKHLRQGSDVPRYLTEMTRKFPRMVQQFSRPESRTDLLFESSYDHEGISGASCTDCDISRLINRPNRPDEQPVIHYGIIASGLQVIKHGGTREKLAKDLNALCFEMEAAGLMNNFPCLVVRGICDYADSHKTKRWQHYVSAVASAFAKELLNSIPAELESEHATSPRSHSSNFLQSEPVSLSLGRSRGSEMSSSSSAKRKAYFKTPYQSSRNFTGREYYLDKIASILFASETSRLALFGLRGSGKTQAAIKFAELHRSRYHCVYFINASSDEDILSDYDKLHDLLELKTTKDTERYNEVRKWLSNEANTPWLLVFDNADSPDSTNLSQLIPEGGHILVTTQDSCIQDGELVDDAIHMEMMSKDESKRLLLSRAGRRSISDSEHAVADQIVEHLGYHPLALDSAAAQVRAQTLTFARYLSTFQERQGNSEQLLRYRPRMSNYDKAIFDVLDINFDSLIALSSPAFSLLVLFAHLDGASIQFSLLDRGVEPQGRVGKDGEPFHQSPEQGCVDPAIARLIRNKIEFGNAIERLKSLSLIYQGSDSSDSPVGVAMHPLVQRHVQGRLTTAQQENGILCALSLVAQAFPFAYRLEEFSRVKPLFHVSFDEYRRLKFTYLPHARACCQNLEKLLQNQQINGTGDTLKLGLRVGTPGGQSMLEIIVALFSEASMVKMRHYGHDLNTTTWCSRFLGLIDRLLQEENDDHVKILQVQNFNTYNYGTGSYKQGATSTMNFFLENYPEFMNQTETKIPISNVPLYNAELCQTLICLAEDSVTETTGKAQYELSHRLLSLCRAVNPEAPSTAESIVLQLRARVVGKILKDEGRHEEAVHALKEYCQICVPGLMDEGWATADWAQCLLELHRNDEAEAVIQQLLATRRQDSKFQSDRPLANGENDHNLLYINLAECYLSQGRLDEAEKELGRLLSYMLNTEVIPHYYTTRIFSIYCGLARIAHIRKDWVTAQKLWEQAVTYGATVSPGKVPWGRKHFYVGVAILSHADALYELGRVNEALAMKKELDDSGIFEEHNRMYWMLAIGTYWLREMLGKWDCRR